MGVFITDGNQRSTLAAVRALGRAGVPVTVGETALPCLASRSRYCKDAVTYPSPDTDGAAFQSFVCQTLGRDGYRMLLPMTDITGVLAAQVRTRLPSQVCLPLPSLAAIQAAHDKREIMRRAQAVGIATPVTRSPESADELRAISKELKYPVVIKARFSRHFAQGHWNHGAVMYAANAEDLADKYQQVSAQVPDPLIQEKIEGSGVGVFLLMWNGELKAAFCHRRLREKPPWGGVSVLRESLPLDRDLVDKSFALLQSLNWQGVAMVEFKVDRRDQTPKLMEINGRFWGSLQLAIDAGMNFPLMLYRLGTGEDIPANFEYKPFVRSRWVLGHIDHLLIRLRYPEKLNGSDGPQWKALLEFLKSYGPRQHAEVFRFGDPRPGCHELKLYVQHMMHRRNRGGEP